MVYKINPAAAVSTDFDHIFDHLLAAYLGMGDSVEQAYERAASRLNAIAEDLEKFALHPHQGTLNNDLQPGLRHVTKERAIFYFWIDEENRTVNILAVFFGGQDHRHHMLERLGKPTTNA
ncbi:hypothetical protein BJF93_04140 [Xaviernesmea oryzae]|uniref:KluB n=1 Tax=Xaviernesmea oryzae TaxID=464029 RepID=A0A1Q9AUI5_9HYPH|nr:type II toxin-antitoxin system RelE/ParE family toxin [Xaviernesmea oryzae]OLP59116.1 hypothetical protein BJF93_04140 [Xaviernesmea oryzae]SEK85887.1 hypothetical protein SAMN04487976_104213 [Xaviernesmea oryzae]